MNGKKARKLRKIARDQADVFTGIRRGVAYDKFTSGVVRWPLGTFRQIYQSLKKSA